MTEDGTTTYRSQFEAAAKAEEYDHVHYGRDSYSEVLWEIEKDQLAAIVADLGRDHDHIDYLDFAAGTGRIIAFLEDKVDTAVGIEISEAMVERARQRLCKGRMICRDITSGDSEIEGQYDLITMFRFVLNAEPTLRIAAVKALAARLRDTTSRLVFNNHGNLVSHKLPLWPYHALRGLGRGYRTAGNYMSHRQIGRLMDAAGLHIERVVGCGFLSAKSMRVFSRDRLVNIERRLARAGALQRFGVNQMYVARLKK